MEHHTADNIETGVVWELCLAGIVHGLRPTAPLLLESLTVNCKNYMENDTELGIYRGT